MEFIIPREEKTLTAPSAPGALKPPIPTKLTLPPFTNATTPLRPPSHFNLSKHIRDRFRCSFRSSRQFANCSYTEAFKTSFQRISSPFGNAFGFDCYVQGVGVCMGMRNGSCVQIQPPQPINSRLREIAPAFVAEQLGTLRGRGRAALFTSLLK